MRGSVALLAAPLVATLWGCTPTVDDPNIADDPAGDLVEDEGPDDVADLEHAGLRKGAGGVSGQGDYCDSGGCTAGEGDCDSSAQCAGGVCLSDNGGRYAGPFQNQQDDHCAPATCNDRDLDPGETAVDCGGACGACTPTCELPDGHDARCTYHCQCAPQEGDCDANDNCVGWDDPNPNLRAVCVADVGARFGFAPTLDHCLPAHCKNRVHDVALGETGIDAGGICGAPACNNPAAGSECTPSCPCGDGGGDCDTNLDCLPGFECREEGATDRCRSGGGCIPTGQELCNGIDDNCDGRIDEGAFDSFDGAALGPQWVQNAVGSPPTFTVSGSRLEMTDAAFAVTPSFPTNSWIYNPQVDRGNQMQWAQPVGTGNFDLVYSFDWNSNNPELTLAGIGLANANDQLDLYAGLNDGGACCAGGPTWVMREPGGVGSVSGGVPGFPPAQIGSGTFRITRTGNTIEIRFNGNLISTQTRPQLHAITDVVIYAVRHRDSSAAYQFGTFGLGEVRLCYDNAP